MILYEIKFFYMNIFGIKMIVIKGLYKIKQQFCFMEIQKGACQLSYKSCIADFYDKNLFTLQLQITRKILILFG